MKESGLPGPEPHAPAVLLCVLFGGQEVCVCSAASLWLWGEHPAPLGCDPPPVGSCVCGGQGMGLGPGSFRSSQPGDRCALSPPLGICPKTVQESLASSEVTKLEGCPSCLPAPGYAHLLRVSETAHGEKQGEKRRTRNEETETGTDPEYQDAPGAFLVGASPGGSASLS